MNLEKLRVSVFRVLIDLPLFLICGQIVESLRNRAERGIVFLVQIKL